MVRFNLESEKTVQRSSLAWSILRPSGFMSNALRWLPQLNLGDVIVAPLRGSARCLHRSGRHRLCRCSRLARCCPRSATYRLTGPAPMVPGEQVAVLAHVLGRPLTFRGQPDEKAYAEMVASMPIDYADALRSFFVDGTYNDAHVLPTVRDVLGRAPRTFEQWAVANAINSDITRASDVALRRTVVAMCRNIRPLNNFEPPASSDESGRRAAVRPQGERDEQAVQGQRGRLRQGRGGHRPHHGHLIDDLVTTAPPKNRVRRPPRPGPGPRPDTCGSECLFASRPGSPRSG